MPKFRLAATEVSPALTLFSTVARHIAHCAITGSRLRASHPKKKNKVPNNFVFIMLSFPNNLRGSGLVSVSLISCDGEIFLLSGFFIANDFVATKPYLPGKVFF